MTNSWNGGREAGYNHVPGPGLLVGVIGLPHNKKMKMKASKVETPRLSWMADKVRRLTRLSHKSRCVTDSFVQHGGSLEDCAQIGGCINYHVFSEQMAEAYKKALATYGLIWRGDHVDILSKAESVIWLRMPLPFGWSVIRWPPETPRCNRVLVHNGGTFHCLKEAGHEPDAHQFELPDCDTRVGK